MKTIPRVLLLFLLPLWSVARADVWVGKSDVTFKGYSTLHDFEGTVTAVPLQVTVEDREGGRLVSATSAVEVQRMNTQDDGRDENMWKMFNTAVFKLIKITVDDVPEAAVRPTGGVPGRMPVTLTMAGTTGKVVAEVTGLRESKEQVSFDLAFPVSLKAFKLTPPSTLAGLIKVKDTVDVKVHVTLGRAKS